MSLWSPGRCAECRGVAERSDAARRCIPRDWEELACVQNLRLGCEIVCVATSTRSERKVAAKTVMKPMKRTGWWIIPMSPPESLIACGPVARGSHSPVMGNGDITVARLAISPICPSRPKQFTSNCLHRVHDNGPKYDAGGVHHSKHHPHARVTHPAVKTF